MPDLKFEVTGVEGAVRALVPLLHFKLRVTNKSAEETVHGAILSMQIQIEAPRRRYSAREKDYLSELFGEPERWGSTLRNKLWTHANATLSGFKNAAETVLPVQCTFDVNVLATKFFSALQEGDVPLRFLFSGSVFYAGVDGQLQVQRISWDSECTYAMPLRAWYEMMDRHFPNTSCLPLRRDVFERLVEFKRQNGMPEWEEVIEGLLAAANRTEIEEEAA